MAGLIYPISMGWQWGGGWLSVAGFSDFAGSTLVHACGGAAALAGVIVLGARNGRYTSQGGKRVMVPFAASSIPLVTLGTFLLWFGWFGFNGFSQLAMGTFDDVNAISKIAVNTHLAGAAGTVTGAAMTRLIGGKTDIVMMLNGALAGLVAITAEPLTPGPITAMVIGSIGAVIMYYGTKMLERSSKIKIGIFFIVTIMAISFLIVISAPKRFNSDTCINLFSNIFSLMIDFFFPKDISTIICA